MFTAHLESPRSEKVTPAGVGLGFSSFSSTFGAAEAVSNGGGFLMTVVEGIGFFFREKSWKFSSTMFSSSMIVEL